MSRKIPSFTVIELLIVILLIGFVIGIGYYAVSGIRTQWKYYIKKENQILNTINFIKVLKLDVWKSQCMYYSSNTLQITDPNTGNLIVHQPENHFWIRKTPSSIDTFLVNGTIATVTKTEITIFLNDELWKIQAAPSASNQLFPICPR